MNLIVRGFAITLVLAGLASTFRTQGHAAIPVDRSPVMQQMPIPVCPPNDPNGCHIDKW